MSSLKSLLSLGLLSLLQYHAALALPTSEPQTSNSLTPRYATTDWPHYDVTLICPSPRAPDFGSTSGAWKILNHLKTLENGPPLPGVEHEDGCSRMGCQEGLGVFWCVRNVAWTYHNAPTYKTLAEQAQMVLDQEKCRTTDATNTRPLVAGEALYGDAWSVILKGLDCKAGQE
ncbi:hypothetical protein B0H65DRAFT_525730 [Neurospora tetraspora]|uniref:Ecp2 effector protein domain-containing protein n=1 Tax=Neurospora tetraspora TaxID=94610 RepID=A0AAE0JFY7_9PEZI|nr:hypothetical protein B0H65DRAFT_525730 [Neurospora tetraspora]